MPQSYSGHALSARPTVVPGPGLTFFGLAQYQQVFSGANAADFFHPFFSLNAMNASRISLFLFLCILATSLTGCEAIGDIFKAGAYTAIIGIFVVVALLWFIVSKMRGPRS
jgi:hypothetical protein